MGKFVLGFIVGAAVGTGVALLLSTRPQSEDGLVASVQDNLRLILNEARRAATAREQELWQEFYERVPQARLPSDV